MLVFFAYLFSHYEKISLFKSLYWALTTASTVGYGDIVPKNNIGRIIAMGLMVFGVSIIGVFLAGLSSIVLDFKLGRFFGTMESHFVKNHVVILGFNDYIKNSLEEILKENDKNVVLMADIDNNPLNKDKLLFIKGDITNEKDINKAKLNNAQLCIIADKDDSKTLISATTVRSLYSKLYIIALVSKKELAKVLVNFGINEVFASGTFSSKLLVKSVYITGVSKFFTQLLDEDFKETLVEKITPTSLANLTFNEALYKLRNETNELLVGVKRDGEIIINPIEKDFRLDIKDRLLLIGK
ncbi:potassium channel family protein [Desulfurella sp.]|uniref:potassium channel family protein n=1 Tax=Desulfurella sp. TaxID=1962857 RepID=UPI003D0B9AF3